MGTTRLTTFIAFRILLGTAGCTTANRQPIPQDIQPDYRRWEQIKVGMFQTEVDALLGKPLDAPSDGSGVFTVYSARYGVIRFDKSRFPSAYEFYVQYHCSDHRVVEKHDPFDGNLSTDGTPTMPSLIYPTDHQQFDHYPRNTDFRWRPSSGVYPMSYEVQLNWQSQDGWGGPGVIVRTATEPCLAEGWLGANTGVWRVRARNRLGVSPWSAERTFSFSR